MPTEVEAGKCFVTKRETVQIARPMGEYGMRQRKAGVASKRARRLKM